jgi:hypothetical protein
MQTRAHVSHRGIAYGIALLGALAAALGLPAVSRAGSGGSGLAPAPSPSSPSASLEPANGNVMLTASGNGITISARASALLRGRYLVSGQVAASDAGDTIEIERLGHQTRGTWAPTMRAVVASDGTFSATWRVNHIGRFALRAVVVGAGSSASDVNAALSSSPASPSVTVTVYRPSVATLYGPGFYGNKTACGEVLHHATIGVANRTLPCGTQVALYYQGRTLVVPVIDRGPYANGADWDITMATARRLGLTETATVGAVSLPPGS